MTLMVPAHSTWDLELFLLGFGQKNVEFFTPGEQEENLKTNYWQKENLFTAFKWLEKTNLMNPENIPHALVLNSALFLDDNNKLFIQSIKKHKDLKSIPLIAISPVKDSRIKDIDLIKLGLDDHYIGEVNTKKLEERIDFITQFKKDYEPKIELKEEQTEYHIPLPKRLFDIAVSSTLILLLSPVLLAIAALVKFESKGNIIYKSKRIGTGYQGFYFLKFRSMFQDADKRLAEIQHLNRYNTNGGTDSSSEITFMKFENDPRITRVGRFIRKTSLDELPQLFNVLRGEMSIVGNRPLPLYEAEQLTKDSWAKRFLAPAGITGLWQVSPDGKDTMSVEQRIGLDIEYANNFSFLKDIQILAKTPLAMIQKGE